MSSWQELKKGVSDRLFEFDPEIASMIEREGNAQERYRLNLIASENYCSLPVQFALSNELTNKYAEGVPRRRYYGGCENIDEIEALAQQRYCKLFGVDHAYVQPHSGSDANLVAYSAILFQKVRKSNKAQGEELRHQSVNQTLMAMGVASGGHISHGYAMHLSALLFRTVLYEVDPETHLLDYDEIENTAMREKPLILLVGYSSYSRWIDFSRMREIADGCGAVLLVDMAHFAGLVAGGVCQGVHDPIPYADLITFTTHKTFGGPRGGVVLCRNEWKEAVDRGCPLVLGGPLPHVIAAKAIAAKEASTPRFSQYAHATVRHAQIMADSFSRRGTVVISGGTDNHLILLDVHSSYGCTGKRAEEVLGSISICTNRNLVPWDQKSPLHTSGLRLGTTALTRRGLGEAEFIRIVEWIDKALRLSTQQPEQWEQESQGMKQEVEEMLSRFPLYKGAYFDCG